MVSVITDSGRATEREMISTPITTTTNARPPRQVRTKAIMWLASVCWRQLLAAFGVDPGKRLEVLVQAERTSRWRHCRPIRGPRRRYFDAAANQFFTEVDELFDCAS